MKDATKTLSGLLTARFTFVMPFIECLVRRPEGVWGLAALRSA